MSTQGVGLLIAQHMFACLCICWFRVRLLWVLELLLTAVGTMDETILLEYIWPLVKHSWLKWSHDKHNTQRDKGLGSAYNSLPALKPWHYLSNRPSHIQMSKSTETITLSKLIMWPVRPIMFSWWQNSSRSVYFAYEAK